MTQASIEGDSGLPRAADDAVVTLVDQPVAIRVLDNDRAAPGRILRLVALGQPRHGAVSVGWDQTIHYVPQSGFTGADGFTYTVADDSGAQRTASVTVEVRPVLAPPVAREDVVTTARDLPVELDPLANDLDPAGGGLRLVGIGLPVHGELVPAGGGRLRYTPAAGFVGTETVAYTLRDAEGRLAEGLIRFEVAPVAGDVRPGAHRLMAVASHPVAIELASLEPAIFAAGFTLANVSIPAGGQLDADPRGRLAYRAAPAFAGPAAIEYRLREPHGHELEGVVTVDVFPPTTGMPFADGTFFDDGTGWLP
jgi:hypothetical protein